MSKDMFFFLSDTPCRYINSLACSSNILDNSAPLSIANFHHKTVCLNPSALMTKLYTFPKQRRKVLISYLYVSTSTTTIPDVLKHTHKTLLSRRAQSTWQPNRIPVVVMTLLTIAHYRPTLEWFWLWPFYLIQLLFSPFIERARARLNCVQP